MSKKPSFSRIDMTDDRLMQNQGLGRPSDKMWPICQFEIGMLEKKLTGHP